MVPYVNLSSVDSLEQLQHFPVVCLTIMCTNKSKRYQRPVSPTTGVWCLQVATLMARVSSLEAQNSQLRVAAAKREQVLQQSRKFIESHLARWAPGTNAPGAAATATATAAAAPAANGMMGRDGPGSNGINPN